jgi:hypothetical protein
MVSLFVLIDALVTVFDSPTLPEADAQFALSAAGVCDATE